MVTDKEVLLVIPFFAVLFLSALRPRLEAYYFRGIVRSEAIVFNRPLLYEISLIIFWLLLSVLVAYLLIMAGKRWYWWIFDAYFIQLWLSRVRSIFSQRNCELRVSTDFIEVLDSIGAITRYSDFDSVLINVTHDPARVGGSPSLKLFHGKDLKHIINLGQLGLNEFEASIASILRVKIGNVNVRHVWNPNSEFVVPLILLGLYFGLRAFNLIMGWFDPAFSSAI